MAKAGKGCIGCYSGWFTGRGFLLGGLIAFLLASSGEGVPVTDGLVVHLSNEVAVDQDGRVLKWNDLSGNGNHAMPVEGKGAPVYLEKATAGGYGAVRFDSIAGDQALQISGDSSFFDNTPITALVVFNQVGPSDADQQRILNFAYGDVGRANQCNIALDLISRVNGAVRAAARTQGNNFIATDGVAGSVGMSSVNIGGLLWDGSGELTAFWTDSGNNSGSETVSGADMIPRDHLYVRLGGGSQGRNDDGFRYLFEGELAEVMIYNRALSSTERNQIQQYLHQKHAVESRKGGLAISLLGGKRTPDSSWNFASCPDYHQGERELYPPVPERVLNRINSFMHDVSQHDSEFLMIAGDLLGGKWWREDFAREWGDGCVDTSIHNAGSKAYPAILRRLEEHGIPFLIPAIGDHEIGDDRWINPVKRDAIPAFRRIFVDTLLKDAQGQRHWPDTVAGVPARPVGTIYEETSYAFQHRNALIVTVDVFETNMDEIISEFGYVDVNLDDEHLDWLDRVLAAGATDDSIDHIIVQGHCGVLWPLRKYRSSGMYFPEENGERFWSVLKRNGVDLYIAGEVHATTVHNDDGLVQMVHGAGITGWHSTWAIITVEPDRLVIEGRGHSKGSGEVESRGFLTIDKSSGTTVVHGDGLLRPIDPLSPEPLIHYCFDRFTEDGEFHNHGDFGNFYYAGALLGGVEQAAGVAGKGVRIEGDALVRSTTFLPHFYGEPMTVAAWIRTEAPGILGIFGNECYQAAKDDVIFSDFNFILDDGILKLADRSGESYAETAGGLALNDGNWHHVAVVVTGGSGSDAVFYVNGQPQQTLYPSGDRNIRYFNGRCLIGHVGMGEQTYPLNGWMDEFMMWGRALDASEIEELFQIRPE